MKKLSAFLFAIIMIFSLTSCEIIGATKDSTEDFTGRWCVDHVECADGYTYPIKPISKLNNFSILLTSDNIGYIDLYESTEKIIWSKSDEGIIIDGDNYSIVDGMICYVVGEYKLYLKK